MLCGLFCFSFRAVVSFSGRSDPSTSRPQYTSGRTISVPGSSSKFFTAFSIDRRQYYHNARAGSDDDDDYGDATSTSRSPSSISPMPSSRSSKAPRRQKYSDTQNDDSYDDGYYYEEEETLPFTEPSRANRENEKLARYQSRRDLDDEEDDEDFYYYDDDDDDEELDYDDDDEGEISSSSGGNFWSNPTGGIDRSRKPPTPPSPRFTRPRRRPEDSSFDPRSRRRKR